MLGSGGDSTAEVVVFDSGEAEMTEQNSGPNSGKRCVSQKTEILNLLNLTLDC